jgi:predicted ATPase
VQDQAMAELPRGTVTMLFTDVEGSTRQLQELGRDDYIEALEAHRGLLRDAFGRHGGVEVEMQGDSFHYAFVTAREAVAAAADAQRALAGHPWKREPLRVRMGVHTGEPSLSNNLYAGLDVHRAARVMSAAHGGQVLLSAGTADLVREELAAGTSLQDLGEHRLKDLLEPQRLYQLRCDDLDTEFPPPSTLENRPTNLPVQPTPLVGRERELREARELLGRDDVRLLTLTGAGGSGKTRLALQLAAEVVEEFPNGVYLVTLAPISDPGLVMQTVAQTLGVREQAGDSIQQTLNAFVQSRELLLLLDNFEQVSDAAPALAELLAHGPALKVVVTSRGPLHLLGEHEYPVPPLASDDAVFLFAERAHAAKPSFTLNGNRPLVVEICRRLDNLPLAIELAAARIKLLPEKALLERLDQRLKLLTGGARDLPERQRTLRAAIEWSHSLLSDDEKRLFRRLAVFAGGATLEAIEGVCSAEGELEPFDSLGSIVDKSLLCQYQSPDGEPRFNMLETIREYALEQLDLSGEEQELRHRHAAHHLDWLHSSGLEWWESGNLGWRRAARERAPDLRAALAWSLLHEPELGAGLACALQGFWFVDGAFAEGADWCDQALATSERLSPELRAGVLRAASEFARFRHEYRRALALKEEALTLYRGLDEGGTLASLLKDLGETSMMLEDYARAEAYVGEALALRRELGDPAGIGHALAGCGEVAMAQGRWDIAAAYLKDAIEHAHRGNDLWLGAAAKHSLGEIARRCGNAAAAAECYTESLALGEELESAIVLGESIEGLAGVALLRGDSRLAATLSGAVEADYERSGTSLAYPAEHEKLVRELRATLSDDEFAKAWSDGRSLTIEEALELARRSG